MNMRLTTEQLSGIDKYIYGEKIDKAKLISYLERHHTINSDIFTSCSVKKHLPYSLDPGCNRALESGIGFHPISRESFLHRIPFYFYLTRNPITHKSCSPLPDFLPGNPGGSNYPEELESFYKDLEFLFYDLGLPLDTIFGYIPDQVLAPSSSEETTTRALFQKWRHYLHLCAQLGWNDYTPERFLTKYNYALETVGLPPIIYAPLLRRDGQYYFKNGQTFSFTGHFPCEDDGTPILRWTCIKAVSPCSVSFSAKKSRCGELIITPSPDTVIYTRGLSSLDNSLLSTVTPSEACEWEQLYAGPFHMVFNHLALKQFRLLRGMTQQDVALAIGASVRTYQKWEAGETTPDCQNLLRIMNWLDIPDIQQLITFTHIASYVLLRISKILQRKARTAHQFHYCKQPGKGPLHSIAESSILWFLIEKVP